MEVSDEAFAKGLWRMQIEEDMQTPNSNAAPQGEFTRRRENAFSVTVLNDTPVVPHNKLSDSQRSVDYS